MNLLSSVLEASILQAEWAERIGWTLVHSVWQVALVAAFVLRRRSARNRQ